MAAVEQNTLKRRGVGLIASDPERAFPGFTLFAPLFVQSRTVYLIDLQGKTVHTWDMPYSPGLSGYLTERGTLYYNGRSPENNPLSRFPFKGGVALEADWTGKVLWEVRHPDHHHDGILLRNGNVLLDCMGQVPDEIAQRVKGGMEEPEMRSDQYLSRPKAEAGKMYSSYLAEVTPAGKTVWEWRTWEHLDPVADGIAEVQAPRTMWHQGNSVQELPDGDILASFRPTSTVVRISREIGKIVWKLGPPTEVNPATNEIVWKYQDSPAWNFFSPRMGCAQRLPNGNTLITESSFGRIFEATKEGEIVWEYVNPFFGKPLFGGREGSESNQVFRAYRYSAEEIARARG